MKVKTVTYSQLINTGSYEHERFELTIDLEGDEAPSEAINRARAFIDAKKSQVIIPITEYNRAIMVAGDPLSHTGLQIQSAKETIKRYEAQGDELPF